MSFWKNLCCCIKDDEINVDEGTRLLPISDYDTTDIKKIESPFTIYAFGVHPPGLNMRLIPLDFCRLGISKIACGAEHILMLSETNFVIAAGNNEYGQCARDPDQPLIRDENEIEIPNESPKNLRMTAFNIDKFKILDIAAGSYHSILLVKPELNYNNNSNTKAMVFGHPLGCGFSDHNYKFVPIEVQIENIRENITGVYAGQMRTAVVLETGRIFVWGEWFTGTKQLKPKEITLPVKSGIKKLAIGKMFTLVLNSFGKVYSIGNNTYGELGVSREVKSSFNLHEIPFFKDMNVIDIDAGARHGLVLNSEGKIYSFGDNSEGQCGIEAGRTYTPTEVPIKSIISGSKPERVYCGEAHSVIITSQGDLFAWGDNTAGRLGLRGGMSIYRPRIVEDIMGKHISSIGCGGLFTAILIGPSKFSIISKKNQTENLIPPK